MNDFTKDELEDLVKCCINDLYKRAAINPRISFTLKNKIQSMIDNYCEHKNIVTGSYPRSNPPKKCDKCGVLYYE